MRRRDEHDCATSAVPRAVEFAFIVPLLIVLVLGIAEFGHAFQVQGTLSAAAREGVRVDGAAERPGRRAGRGAQRRAGARTRPSPTPRSPSRPAACPATRHRQHDGPR